MIIFFMLLLFSIQLTAQNKNELSSINQQQDSTKKILFQKYPEILTRRYRMPTAVINVEQYNMPYYRWPDSIDYKMKILKLPEEPSPLNFDFRKRFK